MAKVKINWIKNAVKNKGSLTLKAKDKDAITKKGTISKLFLKKNAKGNSTLAKQSRLALTLIKFNKGKNPPTKIKLTKKK